MITREELNPHNYPLTDEQQANQDVLFVAINKVRLAYGKPMIITSGVRSEADQQRINRTASKSKHLIGAACDVLDNNGELHAWCKANEELLESAGLWMEERQGNWQHFQCIPPTSGHRWFYP